MIEGQLSKKRRLSLGADPEMFLFSGNKLLPAWEFLPPKGEHVLQYWDGAQAEWKYNHEENHCQNNLVLFTRENLMDLQATAKQHDKNARLSLVNVVRIPKDVLATADPKHIELGCQPSWNAYRMKGTPVYDPRDLKYRFAGGHLHFGTWTPQRPNYVKIVKTLDSILGVWSVGVARYMDNPIRRKYYGLAGEYRMPRYKGGYGVEYRTLSNFWLASPAMLQLTWDIGRMCVRLAGSRYLNLWAGNEDETIRTINDCDDEQAEKILKRNAPMFKWILKQCYRNERAVEAAIAVSREGLQYIVPEPENFKENWAFGREWIPNGGAYWARWETYIG